MIQIGYLLQKVTNNKGVIKMKSIKNLAVTKVAILTLFISFSAYAKSEFQVRGDAMIPISICTNENIQKNLNAVIEAATTVAQVRANEKCGEKGAFLKRQHYIGTSCVLIMDGQGSAVSANVVPEFECNTI
jgi:hypothetical protein